METPLGRWLARYRVSGSELAKRLNTSRNNISMICRGKSRPSDALKVRIAAVTLTYEQTFGVAEPRGVLTGDWFDASFQTAALDNSVAK